MAISNKSSNYKMTKKKKNRFRRIITFSLLLVSVLAISTYFILNLKPLQSSSNSNINLNKHNVNKEKSVNLLVCGIDSDDDRENQFLTDVIMLVNLNLKDNKISVLQIPRDTYIGADIPTGKINAVYNLGSDQTNKINNLINTLDNQFKIKIDHYVTVSMKGFRRVIDEIGGVELDIPYNIPYNNFVDTKISLKKGVQHLDGRKAEVFVRYRAGLPDGDIGRIRAQRLFLKSVFEKIKSSGILIIPKILNALNGNIESDMSISEMAKYGNRSIKIDFEEIFMYTAPGYFAEKNSFSYWGLDKEELANLLNEKFRPFDDKVESKDLSILTLPKST